MENWKKRVGNGGTFRALTTEFSKDFDRLSHDLLIAKQDAYEFVKKVLLN